jgi:hypothetical protein
LAASAVVLSLGVAVSAAGAGTPPGDLVVIGDQVGPSSGSIGTATGLKTYQPGPVAGPPTVTTDPVAHTVTLAVNDAGRAASITLAWPMRPGTWPLSLSQTDPEQQATLTRAAAGCTFTSGNLVVSRAEVAPGGGVAVLSADVTGSCSVPGGPYLGAAVRIGDSDPARAVPVPRSQPASFSTGAAAGTLVRHVVAVTNAGARPWKIGKVGTGSPNGWNPFFTVEAGSDTCTGVTLAPGAQCSVAVAATAPAAYLSEHLVVTGDGPAMLVVPLRLEGYLPVARPIGVSTLPGRLATTVTWDPPSSQPQAGYRVYDTSGGHRTLVASADKAQISLVAPGSGPRTLALVAANGTFAESPDVVLDVPAVTSEVVANNMYGGAVAFATDLPGALPRPTQAGRVDLDASRTRWVTGSLGNISVCRADTEVCASVPGTATSSLATAPQDAVWLPDGTIAFIRGSSSEIRTLWVVRTDGSGLRQVAAIPACWHLAAAPGASEVVLRSTVSAGSIERVRLSDGHKTTVPGTTWIDDFTVSSHGLLVIERRLDLTRNAGPRTTTVMNLDGTGARVLALPAGDNRNVTFDPTGTRVAFSRFTSDYDSSVWVARADGSSPRQLSTSAPVWTIGFVWSTGVSAVTRLSDLTRDGVTDLVARDSAGVLWLYPGNGAGGFQARRKMGAGWNIMTAVVTPGDVTGDGNADVIGRDALGHLWLYPGNGAWGFQARRLLGNGWNVMNMITGAGDLNRAGQPDLLARDTSGVLWLYPMSGNAVLGTRSRIGAGWNGYTAWGPGDVSGDGRPDMLARDPAGVLWLYRGNGTGGVPTRAKIGSAWQVMTALATPGDWDRAGGNDVLARDSGGRLWLYPGNNSAGLGTRRLVGSGWNMMNYIG